MPSIKDHPIIVVSGLIVAAFVAGITTIVWFDKEIDKRIEERIISPVAQNVPTGTIIAYYSNNGEIPDGWSICNGDNGTPDLRNKFIKGAARLSDNGQEGGVGGHSLEIKFPQLNLATGGTGHDKALREDAGNGVINHRTACAGCNLVNSYIPARPTVSWNLDNQPPYTSLVYIMKIDM